MVTRPEGTRLGDTRATGRYPEVSTEVLVTGNAWAMKYAILSGNRQGRHAFSPFHRALLFITAPRVSPSTGNQAVARRHEGSGEITRRYPGDTGDWAMQWAMK
jgi:hypothetical protein